MKKKITMGAAIIMMLLALIACTAKSPADPGNPGEDNPGETVTAGLPSWLTNATWEGSAVSSATLNGQTQTSPVMDGYIMKTSMEDIAFYQEDTISSGESGPGVSVGVDTANGIKYMLNEYGIKYSETGNDSSYILKAPEYKVELQDSDPTTGASISMKTSGNMTVTVKRISDFTIEYTMQIADMYYYIEMKSGTDSEPIIQESEIDMSIVKATMTRQ